METRHIEWLNAFETMKFTSEAELENLKTVLVMTCMNLQTDFNKKLVKKEMQEDLFKNFKLYFDEKLKIKFMLFKQFKASKSLIILDLKTEIIKIESKINEEFH